MRTAVTIGTIFTDRDWLLKGWLDSLAAFDINRANTSLVWVDNTATEYAERVLRDWIQANWPTYSSIHRVLSDEDVHGHGKLFRAIKAGDIMPEIRARNVAIARNYNLIRDAFLEGRDPYLFLYEDDVIAPPRTIRRLLEIMEEHGEECGIAFGWIAHYSQALQGYPGVEGSGAIPLPELLRQCRTGVVEPVNAGAIGMALIRREVMEALAFKAFLGETWGVDIVLGHEANAAGWDVLVDWGLRGLHIVEF